MKDMLTGRGRPHSKARGPGHPPPTSVRLQRPGAGGQHSLPQGRAQLWHPHPTCPDSTGLARVWPPPLWWGRGDLSRRRAEVVGGGAALGACPAQAAVTPAGRGECTAGLSAPGTGLGRPTLRLPSPRTQAFRTMGSGGEPPWPWLRPVPAFLECPAASRISACWLLLSLRSQPLPPSSEEPSWTAREDTQPFPASDALYC